MTGLGGDPPVSKRGNLFHIIPPRQFGKQRPALVVQSTLFLPEAHSARFFLMTGAADSVNPVRILVTPTKGNGLAMPSLIQVHRLVTVDRDRIENRTGGLSAAQVARVDAALRLWLAVWSVQLDHPGATRTRHRLTI